MKLKLTAFMLLLAGNLTTQANPITRAEARLVAQELVGISDNSTDDVPVAPYYIFSRGEGHGFVIVSGDDSTTPILGYTEQGDYDADQMPEQLQAMLRGWGKAIGEVQARRQQAPAGKRRAKARAVAEYKQGWASVDPLIETHWHQSAPYNNLAPIKQGQGRCMTGCVATAGSQVAYYFRRDNNTELQYDTPTYSYGTPITVSLPKGTPLKWNLMKKSGTGTAQQDSAVAVLMYALGTSAWLTYGDGDGTATSGHNYKMGDAMRGQLGLNYEQRYKDDMSDRSWETLIYNNLKTRRPMLYSGVSESQGGHSVVLDGYQANTGLFHFNFGWGGQGDGWYTVDNETGMNGFHDYMDLVYNITPQRQNLSGAISEQTTVYHRTPSTVRVSVKNNGTLDYSGFQLLTNTQLKVPSTTATAKDETTVVVSGGEAQLEFTLNQPTLRDELYLFLCDMNKNPLDTLLLSVTPTVADMRLQSFSVDASDEVLTEGAQQYPVVNNTSVAAKATVTNQQGGTYCKPTLQCVLYSLDTATGEWANVSSRQVNDQTFETGETKTIVFTFNNLKEGTFYKAEMVSTVRATQASELQMEEGQGVQLFTVRPSDLVVTPTGDRTATVSGRWNETLFSRLASDASVTTYDISQLTQLNSQPMAANPNALFYGTAEQTDLLKFSNVVAGDQCAHLVVHTNAEFMPSKAFTAERATLVLAHASSSAWQSALVPFAAKVPYGMQVRQASGIERNLVSHDHVTEVEPMSAILYITGHQALDSLTGSQVTVGTATETRLFDDILFASTLNNPMPDGAKVLGVFATMNYYMAPDAGQTVLPAFQPALTGATIARMRVSEEPATERNYALLAQAINEAYNAIGQHTDPAATTLADVLKQAEDMLSYRTTSDATDISSTANRLSDAVAQYAGGGVNGVSLLPDTSKPTGVRYYNLAGQRLSQRPASGVVIIVENGKARKLRL